MAEVKLTVVGEDKTYPAQQGLTAVEKMIGMVKTAAVALGISFSAMMAVDYAKDATMMAARYHTLGATMQVVGNNAGYTREQMHGFEMGLRQTGIAMVESRYNLSVLSQAHIDLSKSVQLARMAQDAAVIGGINSSEAFTRLIYGIQSAQPEMLRTIGINVNFEDSYKKLSRQLGKNIEDLTELEKVQARTNVVLEKGRDIAGAYEAAMGTAGKQINSMKRYMDDLKVKVGEVFQDALTIAVGWATDGLKGLNKEAEELSQKRHLDAWGRDATMALAFVADAVRYPIIMFRSLADGIAIVAVATVAQFSIMAKAASGDFSGMRSELNGLKSAYGEYRADINKMWDAPSFQERAKGFLAEKDAALKNVDAMKAQEEARIKAGAATREETEARAKQEIAEKNFISDLKNNIGSIKDYAAAMRDLGKERLAFADDRYKDRLKQEIDLYKEGERTFKDLISPIKRYNVEVNDVYNERMVNERAALTKLANLYSEFKSKISITANIKDVKQHGVELLKEIKGQAEQIIAVETSRYKTLIAGEQEYASKVKELIQAKKAEIKDLQIRFEEANKTFEEKKRQVLGDYSGGYSYLNPALDSLAKYQVAVEKLKADEIAYDQLTDPARKKEKLLGLIDTWGQLDQQIELAGQVVITREQAIAVVQEERLRLQGKIIDNARAEKMAFEKTYDTAIGKIDAYKNKIVELDDLLTGLTRDVVINLKINGLEQIARIQGIIGQATASPFASIATSAAVTPDNQSPQPVDDYYQSGDAFYWSDGSYGGPAYEQGTPFVPRTGLALVHQGEQITPANSNTTGGSVVIQGGITFSLPNVTNQTTADELARQVLPKLQSLIRQRYRQAA